MERIESFHNELSVTQETYRRNYVLRGGNYFNLGKINYIKELHDEAEIVDYLL